MLTPERQAVAMSAVRDQIEAVLREHENEAHGGQPCAGKPEKQCKECKRRLPIDRFYRRKDSRHGLRYECKDCCTAKIQRYKQSELYRQRKQDRKLEQDRVKSGVRITTEEYQALLADPASEPTKRCFACKQRLPISRFYPAKCQRRYGVRSSCKQCCKDASRNRKQTEEQLRRNREKTRRRSGIDVSEEQFQALFAAQSGVCAICGLPETRRRPTSDGTMPLSVDHDHATGQIRQLLCNSCNRGLGDFRDKSELLVAAAAYLRKHGK